MAEQHDEYEQITFTVADSIATITLDRPRARNGYTPRMAQELRSALQAADSAADVRVVVLTGAGEDFCVGADLSGSKGGGAGFASAADPEAEAQAEAGTYQESAGLVTRVLYGMDKPVIAAVRGAAVGAGATVLLPADFRLAATDSRFGFPFSRRGIVAEGASTWYLPRLVGLTATMDWLVSGRIIGAQEALRAGLLTSVHEPGKLLDAAYELAAELVRRTSPVSVALIRQLVYRMAWSESPEEVHRLDSRLVFDTVRSADAAEGVASFFERRDPDFPGRVPDDLPDYLPWRQQHRE